MSCDSNSLVRLFRNPPMSLVYHLVRRQCAYFHANARSSLIEILNIDRGSNSDWILVSVFGGFLGTYDKLGSEHSCRVFLPSQK